MKIVREHRLPGRTSGALAALLVAAGLTAGVAAERAQPSPQGVPQAAPATPAAQESGLRAADDATQLALAICAEVAAAKDVPSSQAPLRKVRDLTTGARTVVVDVEAARSAAVQDMLAAKVVKQEHLDRVRRAGEALLAAHARRYAVQAVQDLIEPCAADRREQLMAAADPSAAPAPAPAQSDAVLSAALDNALTGLQPLFRRLADSLVLMDQSLRLRVARGALTSAQADAVLREWATALALRDLSRGPDPEVVAEYRAEASTFLQNVQKAIPKVTKWPDDRPANEYAPLATAMLQLVSQLYTADFARGFAPTSELVEGQLVQAWTLGSREVTPAKDVFDGEYDRLLNAISSAMPALPRPRPAPVEKGCQGFAGTWTTNYGDVILTVTGDQAAGENPSYRAKLKGSVTGQTLDGMRSIAGFPDVAIHFVLATDGAKFDGTVTLAPGHTIAWNGSCAALPSAPR